MKTQFKHTNRYTVRSRSFKLMQALQNVEMRTKGCSLNAFMAFESLKPEYGRPIFFDYVSWEPNRISAYTQYRIVLTRSKIFLKIKISIHW